MNKPLQCGAAMRIITPPPELLRRLRGLGNRRFAGVLDDLFVRVIALEQNGKPLLLVSFDLTCPPAAQKNMQALQRETGVPPERILFFAIHTHAAPVTEFCLEPWANEVPRAALEATEEYQALLTDCLLQAAAEALAGLQPARIGWGFGQSRINVNRFQNYYVAEGQQQHTVVGLGADPAAPADPTLFALRAETEAGQPIAFFLNYPMHNVVTIWNDLDGAGGVGLSSDVGGNTCRLLEQRYPGSVALWSSGAAADLNPIMLNEIIYPDPLTGRPTQYAVKGVETAQVMCRQLAARHFADVLQVLKTVQCAPLAGELGGAVEVCATPGCRCTSKKGEPWVFETGPNVPQHTIRLHLVKLGPLGLLGMSGELYSSLWPGLWQAASLPLVLITHEARGLSNCHYIFDDDILARAASSGGMAMVPGYTALRNQPGLVLPALQTQVRRLVARLEQEQT